MVCQYHSFVSFRHFSARFLPPSFRKCSITMVFAVVLQCYNSVIVEALKVDSLQKLCSSLESILRRVRNGQQGSVSKRARRDAASLSMQGSNSQHHSGHSVTGEPSIKDKNPSNMAIREKNTKSIGSIKQKRPNDADHSIKAAQTETSKQ